MPQLESLVLVVSDVHIGKKTKKYNVQVARKILHKIAEKLKDIVRIMDGEYEFNEVVLCFLGDILDGTDIFPAQATVQDIPNVFAQALVAAELFMPVIEAATEIADKVRLCGVAGNHGRSGRNAAEAANWDIVCYQQLAMLATERFKGKVICQFNIPQVLPTRVKETDLFWLQLVNIKGHYFLLHHGHKARMVLGVPWYSLKSRALSWRSALREKWKVLLHGHFHQFGRMDFNDITILLNGTSVQHDTWALENFGLQGINKWWLFGTSKKYPMTFQFALEVTAE